MKKRVTAVILTAALTVAALAGCGNTATSEPAAEATESAATTATQEAEKIGNIDVQEKSDTRIAIEKFVDENPEAVALLLRNWLNEGWE